MEISLDQFILAKVNFGTKFSNAHPLYFAPPQFKAFKIRSLQFSPPSRRKLKEAKFEGTKVV